MDHIEIPGMFHKNLQASLTDFQKNYLLSQLPTGARILRTIYFDNYDLPCPIRVDIVVPDGTNQTLVLRSMRHGNVEFEVKLLKTLSKIGLPVPLVLAEPVIEPNGEPVVLLSFLPGTNLQALSMQSKESLQLAKHFLIEGISHLSEMTNTVITEPIGKSLPHYSLLSQLQSVTDKHLSWSQIPLFIKAIRLLEPLLQNIQTPLVFTNGDYQPANFLTDGMRVTGFVDFEYACFQDPLIGFAKYPIYDVHPMNKGGVVQDFLDAKSFTKDDFAPRLALGCLMTLQKEIPVNGGSEHDQRYRKHVLGLLENSMKI